VLLMGALLIFVVGLELRSVGLGMERRAHLRLMQHEARWCEIP
jgi:hypothetical protein